MFFSLVAENARICLQDGWGPGDNSLMGKKIGLYTESLRKVGEPRSPKKVTGINNRNGEYQRTTSYPDAGSKQ